MTRAELDNKIKELLGLQKTTPLPSMVNSQIAKYVTERGWSYLEIARAVAYVTVIKKQKMDINKFGIGLVPLVMEEARAYFLKEKLKRAEQERQVKDILKNKNNYDIICKQPKRRKKIKRKNEINISDIREDDDE